MTRYTCDISSTNDFVEFELIAEDDCFLECGLDLEEMEGLDQDCYDQIIKDDKIWRNGKTLILKFNGKELKIWERYAHFNNEFDWPLDSNLQAESQAKILELFGSSIDWGQFMNVVEKEMHITHDDN